MQKLLKDIKAGKIDEFLATNVNRVSRDGNDGFWLLNNFEKHNVKMNLIDEPYDISTANGEMMFGMNLIFGQRERKEIGIRTKRGLEQMVHSGIHPSRAS